MLVERIYYFRGSAEVTSPGRFPVRYVSCRDSKGNVIAIFKPPYIQDEIAGLGSFPPRADLSTVQFRDCISDFSECNRERVATILGKYHGVTSIVKSLMAHAERAGRFEEYADKLEKEFGISVKNAPAAVRTAHVEIMAFLARLFEELGLSDKSTQLAMNNPTASCGVS